MKFEKIMKNYGSNLHLIEFYVYEDDNEIGFGGQLVNIEDEDGKIEYEQNLCIILKDKKQILLINGKIIFDKELESLKFNFLNKDY